MIQSPAPCPAGKWEGNAAVNELSPHAMPVRCHWAWFRMQECRQSRAKGHVHAEEGHPRQILLGWGAGGTHHRSWAPATRRALLSGRRQRRSWPRRCTSSPGRPSRSRRRSGSSAGRAAGPRRGGRPRTWGTSGESTPPLRTWLWGRGEKESPTPAWVPGARRNTVVSYSPVIPASPSAAQAPETPLAWLCDVSSPVNVLS